MLDSFLLQAARSDHIWSQSDCAMTIANWWLFKYGVDPAADLRGSYHTEDACRAVIAVEGGMLEVIGKRAARVAATKIEVPEPGSFGVIMVHGVMFGAILGFTGRWMVKSPRGMAGYRCSHIAAWRS